MKRLFSLFLVLSLFLSGVALAEVLDTGKNGVVLPVIVPNFEQNEEDVVKFVEVKDENTVTVETQPLNQIRTYQGPANYGAPTPVSTKKRDFVQVVKRKPIKDYIRLYGLQYFSSMQSEARVRDWQEFYGLAPRSVYSNSQRSSRVNALYGKNQHVRYYPALRQPTRELAGVFEYDSKLLVD